VLVVSRAQHQWGNQASERFRSDDEQQFNKSKTDNDVYRLTFERKKRTSEVGSKGMRPETVKGRDLAARTLEILSRKMYSSSGPISSLLEITRREGVADWTEPRSISKSDKLGLL
jgi:hypothetical protein